MENIRPGSMKAWIAAARPKTLTGAMIPVLAGSALAYADGSFKAIPALICLFFAMEMQIIANFINDLFDYLKGTDREDRLGPERACAQGWITPKDMKRGIMAGILLAALTGSLLLFFGGWELILIGLACILFAFFYTTGPYPLSYNGWGDVLVLLFFGFVPVGGTYYVQTLDWTPWTALISLICGLLIDTLLVVNNYRDRDTDRAGGKKTIIVRFGEKFGRYFYLLLGIAAGTLPLIFLNRGMFFAAALPLNYLIPHYLTWKKMVRIRSGKALNGILGETSRNMILLGLLLSAGLILG